MKTKGLTHSAIGFTLLAMTLHFLGCSAIGFFVGANIDSEGQSTMVAPSSYARLEPGTDVTVLLQDSTGITGTFGGQGRLSDEQYAARYNAWCANQRGDSAMPQIGDELFLLRSSATTESVSGYLAGFDPECVLVRTPKGNGELNFWNPAVENIYTIRGQAISMKGLMARMEKGQIPYLSYIRILNEGTTQQIPDERIREFHKLKTTYWKWVGLFSGLAVDCTAFFLLQSYARQFEFHW